MYLTKSMLAQRSPDPTTYWRSVTYPRALALDHPEHFNNDPFLPSTDDIRANIDKELHALRNVFTFFQSRRNALSPICRLPSELLAQIFDSIDDDPRRVRIIASRGATPTEVTSLGWITITHVCRHWRYVAFEHPRLWRTISFALGPSWTAELLTRSKAAQITLSHLSEPFSVPFDSIPIRLASHLNHTEHIHVRTDRNSMRMLFKHLSLPAPHLESLQLTAVPTGGFVRSRTAVPVILPAGLFQGSTPMLKKVSLTRLHVPWAEWPFRNLHNLALTLPNPDLFPSDDSALPTLDQILDILEISPELETLRLGYTLPLLPSYITSLPLASRVVRLPNVKELVFEGRPLECANLFRSLQIPCGARVKMACASRREDNEDCQVLLALLRRHTDGYRPRGQEKGEGRIKTLWITNHASHVAITTWDKDVPTPHYYSPLSLSSFPSSPSTSSSSSSPSHNLPPLPPPVLDISFSWPSHITRSGPATVATTSASPLPSHPPTGNPFSHSSVFSTHSHPHASPHFSSPAETPPTETLSPSDTLLNNICSHLGWEAEPGRDVRTVIVSTSLPVTKDRWRGAFGGMLGLRGVSASGGAGVALMEAAIVESLDVFLPNLEWVELYAVDFRSRTVEVDLDDPEGPLCCILESLKRRQASVAPLKRLKITGCTVKKEWVDMVKMVMTSNGGEVEWDGKIGEFAEESDSEMDEEVQVWS